MTDNANGKGKAFVLMPFDESLSDVYEILIRGTFEQAGFSVYRADDIESQQNILSDIVSAIVDADVIVADLTDSNPNVYYELGLAHALRKPVVLLTQDIGSVPFDLRSYRVLEYDTHFARFEESRERLGQLASQIRTGSVAFGSPVSDFGPREATAIPGSKLGTFPDTDGVETETDGPGFLDGIIEVQEQLQELNGTVTRFGAVVSEFGELATQATPKLGEAAEKQDLGRARSLLRSLGTDLQKGGNELRSLNKIFKDSLLRTSDALEVVVSYIIDTGQASEPAVLGMLAGIETLETQCRKGNESISLLVQTLDAIPRVERNFDKARRKIIQELTEFSDNTDQLISMLLRVRSVVGEH